MSWLRHLGVTTPEVASLGMMPPNAVSTAPHWALCLQMGRHRRGRGEVTERCSHLLVFSLHADWFPAVPSSSGHDAESGLLSSSDIEETFGQLMKFTEKQERVHDGGFVLS